MEKISVISSMNSYRFQSPTFAEINLKNLQQICRSLRFRTISQVVCFRLASTTNLFRRQFVDLEVNLTTAALKDELAVFERAFRGEFFFDRLELFRADPLFLLLVNNKFMCKCVDINK